MPVAASVVKHGDLCGHPTPPTGMLACLRDAAKTIALPPLVTRAVIARVAVTGVAAAARGREGRPVRVRRAPRTR
jgi:hypothetical protein